MRLPGRSLFIVAVLSAASRLLPAAERIYVPSHRDQGQTIYVTLTIHPFENQISYASDERSHRELSRDISFVYDFYARDPRFTAEEVALLRRRDQTDPAGSYAYVVSYIPQTNTVRGVLRLALSQRPPPSRAYWRYFETPGGILIPMEVKYPESGIREYNERRFPRRVEWGQLGCQGTARERMHTMVQLVRSGLLLLKDLGPEWWSVADSPGPQNTSLYESFGLQVQGDAPLPAGKTLLAAPVFRSIDQMLVPIERALRIPTNIDPYGDDSLRLTLANLESVPRAITPGLLRGLGRYGFYRCWCLLSLGRFAEARRELESLRAAFGDEPELLSLELELESRSRVNFWTGQGDTDGLRSYLERNRDHFSYARLNLEARRWNALLFWRGLNELAAGRFAAARAFRDAMNTEFASEGIAAAEIVADSTEYRSVASVAHGQYLYLVAPLGLTGAFNRRCADLLGATERSLLVERARALETE